MSRRSLTPASLFGLLLAVLSVLLLAPPRPSQAAPTSIVYTGQLLTSTSPPTPANGSYDFQFQLFNAATGGTQVGPTVSLASVPVVDGIYQVQLSFGNVFTGQTVWLQVSYRVHPASGSPPYTALSPRQVAPNSAFADYATLSGSTQGLQTKAVSTAYPTTGQVLTYSGTLWAPATPAAATLRLPYSGSASSSSPLLSVTNSGSGSAVMGTNSANGDYGFLGGVDPQYGAPVGVFGSDTSSAGTNGIFGLSVNGTGTAGVSTGGFGVYGSSSSNDGIQGQSADGSHSGVAGVNSGSGNGVFGVSRSSGDSGFLGGTDPDGTPAGVYGSDTSSGGYGVEGFSASNVAGSFTGLYAGVVGSDTNTNTQIGSGGVYGYSGIGEGVYGSSDSGTGVYGTSNSGTAGVFHGDVSVSGTLYAGTKDFRIDHPLDPAHKYLDHASVESDKMEDVYNGHVVLDASGAATVTLPSWFQALNGDFEYHLTPIGASAPNLYVASEVQNNQFGIAGGKPGLKVSWQVMGVRHDAYAQAHPLQVEQDKPAEEQGLYLHPKEWGQPEEMGIGYVRQQKRHLPRMAQP